ncbi:hypothetical protein PG994_008799 [Apiospora phragmitis]|uniref:Uncharacterized protein n=1 Tax=Apiospora phragmitis TaxID=2905665 RepID=A0ABR1UHG6_9PEZI
MASPFQSTDGRSSLLTFGIEMEFVVAYLHEGDEDPHLVDKRDVYIAKPHADFVRLESRNEVKNKWRDLIENPGKYIQENEDPKRFRAKARLLRARGLEGRLRYGDEDDPEEYQYIRHRMAKFLRDHSILAISDSNDPETQRVVSDSVKKGKDRLGLEKDDKNPSWFGYSCWDVNTDASIDEDYTKEYRWAKIEVTSPVLYYSQQSLALVKYVINLLQSEYRILINHTMMFHVHVGRGARGFSFTELQGITALLYAAAPRLDQLHPVWCGPLTTWAPGPRPHSLMANLKRRDIKRAKREAQAAHPYNPLLTTEVDIEETGGYVSRLLTPYYRPQTMTGAHEMLQQWFGHQRANAFGVARIWQTQTLEELYDCLSTVYLNPEEHSYHYRPAYNFRNLVDEPVTKKTIEFRQHCGTMSPDAIANWISVATGLCSLCVNTPLHEGLSPVLQKLEHLDPNSATSWEMNNLPRKSTINTAPLLSGRRGDPYSIYDLLRDIGRAPQAEFYQKLGIHPLPPDFFVVRDLEVDYGLKSVTKKDESSTDEKRH